MRTDLGRLDAIPEILQVGPALKLRRCPLGDAAGAVIYRRETLQERLLGEHVMRMLSVAVALVLLTAPAFGQTDMHINMIPDLPTKSPEEKEQDAVREKAYKESLKKIPDSKSSSDPWGTVRNSDASKAAAPA